MAQEIVHSIRTCSFSEGPLNLIIIPTRLDICLEHWVGILSKELGFPTGHSIYLELVVKSEIYFLFIPNFITLHKKIWNEDEYAFQSNSAQNLFAWKLKKSAVLLFEVVLCIREVFRLFVAIEAGWSWT